MPPGPNSTLLDLHPQPSRGAGAKTRKYRWPGGRALGVSLDGMSWWWAVYVWRWLSTNETSRDEGSEDVWRFGALLWSRLDSLLILIGVLWTWRRAQWLTCFFHITSYYIIPNCWTSIWECKIWGFYETLVINGLNFQIIILYIYNIRNGSRQLLIYGGCEPKVPRHSAACPGLCRAQTAKAEGEPDWKCWICGDMPGGSRRQCMILILPCLQQDTTRYNKYTVDLWWLMQISALCKSTCWRM